MGSLNRITLKILILITIVFMLGNTPNFLSLTPLDRTLINDPTALQVEGTGVETYYTTRANVDELANWESVNDGDAPMHRYDHGVVCDRKNGDVYVFGGIHYSSVSGNQYMSDLWRYDLETKTWKEIIGTPPPGRSSFGMVYDESNEVIYVFGGYSYLSGNNKEYSDLWKYSITSKSWSLLHNGFPDLERYGMDIALDEEKGEIYVFGGYSIDHPDRYLDDFYRYSISKSKWNLIGTTFKPPDRAFHRLVMNPSSQFIYLFGGRNNSNTLNDLWYYDIYNNEWKETTPPDKPYGRVNFGMIYRKNDNNLYVFGGYYGSSRLNDTWRYDIYTNSWDRIDCKNTPSQRGRFDMAFNSKDDSIFLFGGYRTYDDLWKFAFPNAPPYSTMPVSNNYKMFEDVNTSGDDLIDLEYYFDDDSDDNDLRFEMTYQEDSNILNAVIDGKYIDFIQTASNWSGKLGFRVKAYDKGRDKESGTEDDMSVESNLFNVTVVPTNDPPEIRYVGFDKVHDNFVEIFVNQNIMFNATVQARDIDNDNITYTSNSTSNDFKIGFYTGKITFLPGNDIVGYYHVKINADDGNGSKTYTNILFNVTNANDPPYIPFIESPDDGAEFTTNDLINFVALIDDPDLHVEDSDEALYCTWTSNIDGVIGSQPKLYYRQLSQGNHVILVDVYDRQGAHSFQSIDITVTKSPEPLDIDTPVTALFQPLDNKIISKNSVELSWSTNFDNPEVISFEVLFGTNPNPTVNIMDRGLETTITVDDLQHGTIYYWTVIPYYGNLKGTCESGVWSFSIDTGFTPDCDFSIDAIPLIRLETGKYASEKITFRNLGNNVNGLIINVRTNGLLGIRMPDWIILNESESKTVDIVFNVPESAPLRAYEVTITATAEDGTEKEFILTAEVIQAGGDNDDSQGRGNLIILGGGIIVAVIVVFVVYFLFTKMSKQKKERELLVTAPMMRPEQSSLGELQMQRIVAQTQQTTAIDINPIMIPAKKVAPAPKVQSQKTPHVAKTPQPQPRPVPTAQPKPVPAPQPQPQPSVQQVCCDDCTEEAQYIAGENRYYCKRCHRYVMK